MRLYALHCGDQVTDAGLLDSGKMSHTLRRIPTMAFAVETSEGLVLFDTGMNHRCATDAPAYLGRLAEKIVTPVMRDGDDVASLLGHAGFGPGDVHLVVNSHLHFDHAGMNLAFPVSRVVIRARELDHALGVPDASQGFYRSDYWSPELGPRWDYDETWDLLGDGSLTLVSTPGHTPGHQSMVVAFPSGRRFALTGDAVYTEEQLARGEPPGLCWDRGLARDASRLLGRLAQQGATVLVGHEPDRWLHAEPVSLVHEE